MSILPPNIEYRSKYDDPASDGLLVRDQDATELEHVEFAGVLDQNGHTAVTIYENEDQSEDDPFHAPILRWRYAFHKRISGGRSGGYALRLSRGNLM